MIDLNVCPKCNAKVNVNSKFCQKCGAKLEKHQEKESKQLKFNKSDQLTEFNNIVGKDALKQEYISMLSQENLNETAGKVIKSNCLNLINKDSFTYEKIATYEIISYKQYSYLLNVIAHLIVTNGKEFKKRDYYEYFGQKEDKRKIIDKIKNNGENFGTFHLITKFVECAVIDNEGLSFLPNYVIGDNGRKFSKDEFLAMIKHVYKYENTYGVSPKFVFASNKLVNTVQLDTSFENKETLHDLIFDKINLMISAYSIQVENALDELNKRVVNTPGKLVFQGRLMFDNLDKNPHGTAIKNRLEDRIYALEITSENIDDKISEEIQIEVENKKNKLKNKVYETIGNKEVNEAFLIEISKYNLDKEDAVKIKNEIVNEIDERNIKESDYSATFNEVLDKHKIARKHQLLFENLVDVINTDESTKKLKNHDLFDKKEIIIAKLHDDILNNKIENEHDIKIALNDSIYFLEKNDVKNELKQLDDVYFNALLKKFSISSFVPLKRVKIEKLLDKISVESIKSELIKYGITKYDHSNVDETVTPENDVNQAVIDDKTQNDVNPEENNESTEESVNETVDDDNSQDEASSEEEKKSSDDVNESQNVGEETDSQSGVSSKDDTQLSEEKPKYENEQTVDDNSIQDESNDAEPICPNCGFKNRSSVKFCTQCGTKLE